MRDFKRKYFWWFKWKYSCKNYAGIQCSEKEQQNGWYVKTKTKPTKIRRKVTALTLNFLSKSDMLPRFLGWEDCITKSLLKVLITVKHLLQLCYRNLWNSCTPCGFAVRVGSVGRLSVYKVTIFYCPSQLWNIKMSVVTVHLNAEVILVVTL